MNIEKFERNESISASWRGLDILQEKGEWCFINQTHDHYCDVCEVSCWYDGSKRDIWHQPGMDCWCLSLVWTRRRRRWRRRIVRWQEVCNRDLVYNKQGYLLVQESLLYLFTLYMNSIEPLCGVAIICTSNYKLRMAILLSSTLPLVEIHLEKFFFLFLLWEFSLLSSLRTLLMATSDSEWARTVHPRRWRRVFLGPGRKHSPGRHFRANRGQR